MFQLSNHQGELVAITDGIIDPHTRENLGYNQMANPVTLVLDHSLELFLTLPDRTLPLYEFYSVLPGKLFGTYWVLTPGKSHQPLFVWDLIIFIMKPKAIQKKRKQRYSVS